MMLPDWLEEKLWLVLVLVADGHQLDLPKLVQRSSSRVKSTKMTPQTNPSVLVVTLMLEWAMEQEKQV